jgi:hypothetical protein
VKISKMNIPKVKTLQTPSILVKQPFIALTIPSVPVIPWFAIPSVNRRTEETSDLLPLYESISTISKRNENLLV